MSFSYQCHCMVVVFRLEQAPIEIRFKLRSTGGGRYVYTDPDCRLCSGSGAVSGKHSMITVDVHHDSTSESWAHIYRDGTIVYHTENNEARLLRRGLEKHDEKITLEDLVRKLKDGLKYAEVRDEIARFYTRHDLGPIPD